MQTKVAKYLFSLTVDFILTGAYNDEVKSRDHSNQPMNWNALHRPGKSMKKTQAQLANYILDNLCKRFPT